ncbi:MAG: hypothetical protein V3R24_05785 [Gemmatimonadales bacterium]
MKLAFPDTRVLLTEPGYAIDTYGCRAITPNPWVGYVASGRFLFVADDKGASSSTICITHNPSHISP